MAEHHDSPEAPQQPVSEEPPADKSPDPPAATGPGGSHRAPTPDAAATGRPKRSRLRRVAPLIAGWSAALTLVTAGFIVPFPYVIESPGPTYNVLGEVQGKGVIEIQGHQAYPANGALKMTTVYVHGTPGTKVTGFDLFRAWAGGQSEIRPFAEVFSPSATQEQVATNNRLEMENSQSAAIAAALRHESIPFEQRLVVQSVLDDGASKGKLEIGDLIVRVSGETAPDVAALRRSVAAGKGAPIEVVVNRQGTEKSVWIVPKKTGDSWLLGIALKNEFTFPFTPVFNLSGVGGPSAGTMFALGIIDELTPGDLTGGKSIAGTGTIDSYGVVGPIGGIQQKMLGAKRDGAEYFLAPNDNCSEVVGHVPEGMTVIKVSTLDEAYRAVKAIGEGYTPQTLPGAFPYCQ